MIDPVLVGEPVAFAFAGAISESAALACWTWVTRDLCSEIFGGDSAGVQDASTLLDPLLPLVVERMREALRIAGTDGEALRRLRVAVGRDDASEAVSAIIGALRNRSFLGKAEAFGRLVNTLADDGALLTAIQSMPLSDPPLVSHLFFAAMGQVTNPARMIGAVVRLSGQGSEAAIQRAGYGPVIDAVLAHAQNQVGALRPEGPFSDTDLTCRALERYHRLVRSLTGNLEFVRGSRWSLALAGITRLVSERIEPRLRDLVPDLHHALRQAREGSLDRLDNDRLLAALNGMYLLSTVRDCRDSLALNALFDQTWTQSGQALELHLERNLDLIRKNPADPIVAARLEAGIKMAEIRFNPEYAETLRRARLAAERRV
jgi:hypothetical protein